MLTIFEIAALLLGLSALLGWFNLRFLKMPRPERHKDCRHHCVRLASLKIVAEFLHFVECLTPLLKRFRELALFSQEQREIPHRGCHLMLKPT